MNIFRVIITVLTAIAAFVTIVCAAFYGLETFISFSDEFMSAIDAVISVSGSILGCLIAWIILRFAFSSSFFEIMPHLEQSPGHGHTIFAFPIFYLLITVFVYMAVDLYPWIVFVHAGIVLTAYIRAAFKSYDFARKVYSENLEKSRHYAEEYGYSKGFEEGLKLGYENGYHAALKKYGIVPDEPITNPSDEEPDTVDDNYGGVFIEDDDDLNLYDENDDFDIYSDTFTIDNTDDPFTRRFG